MAVVKAQSVVGEIRFFPKKVVRMEEVFPEKKKKEKKEIKPALPKIRTAALTSKPESAKMDMWTGLLAFSLIATAAYLIAEKGD